MRRLTRRLFVIRDLDRVINCPTILFIFVQMVKVKFSKSHLLFLGKYDFRSVILERIFGRKKGAFLIKYLVSPSIQANFPRLIGEAYSK